jgi:hypothetical protein
VGERGTTVVVVVLVDLERIIGDSHPSSPKSLLADSLMAPLEISPSSAYLPPMKEVFVHRYEQRWRTRGAWVAACGEE